MQSHLEKITKGDSTNGSGTYLCGYYYFYSAACGHFYDKKGYKCGKSETGLRNPKVCQAPSSIIHLDDVKISVRCKTCRRKASTTEDKAGESASIAQDTGKAGDLAAIQENPDEDSDFK
ncbi:Uu.00g021730.m01.CDS01 [Anthostomella pinea]|uniref:Uu.00g021730.m01.CDS01 n=1 Tax=Anthostomella pinea TaxID=933095 RepID=A0AAI8W0D1_9PEZI|nr:Uu.00g021730.m01.CDS01 [Anthostomella pinea]